MVERNKMAYWNFYEKLLTELFTIKYEDSKENKITKGVLKLKDLKKFLKIFYNTKV